MSSTGQSDRAKEAKAARVVTVKAARAAAAKVERPAPMAPRAQGVPAAVPRPRGARREGPAVTPKQWTPEP